MTKSFWKILAIAGVAMLYSAPVQAQATRTWVSGVGDDVNPCSRTAPCKTFAGAISKTAASGEINCLDSGGFGAVTITKSIAIQCDGTVGGILAAGTAGIIVNAAATDTVFLSGLDINGIGTGTNGINFIRGGALHVRNTVIRGFLTNGINFAPATGSAATAKLVVQDSVVADNPNAGTGGGILVKPAATFNAVATVTNVHMDRNLFGLKAEDRSKVTVSNSSASGNTNNGINALSTTDATVIRVIGSTASDNGLAGVRANGALATVQLLNSAIVGNATGIEQVNGGTISGTTPDTNLISGNATDGVTSTGASLQ